MCLKFFRFQKWFHQDEERTLDNKDSLQDPLSAHKFSATCEELLGLFVTSGFQSERGSTIYDSRSENKFIIHRYCFVRLIYIKQCGFNFTAAPQSPQDLSPRDVSTRSSSNLKHLSYRGTNFFIPSWYKSDPMLRAHVFHFSIIYKICLPKYHFKVEKNDKRTATN